MFDEKTLIAQREKSRKEKRSKELIPARMKIALEGFSSQTDKFQIAPEFTVRRAQPEERQAFWSRVNIPNNVEQKATDNEFFAEFDFNIPRGAIRGFAPGNGIELISIFFSIGSASLLNVNRGNFYVLAGDKFRSAGFYTVANDFPFTQKAQFTNSELNSLKLLWPHFRSQFDSNFNFSLVARRYFYSQSRLSLEDKIIDLMISLEALLIPEKSGTKGDKVATRLAQMICQEYDRLDVEKLSLEAYRIRNNIIHGGHTQFVEAFDIDLMSKYCRAAIQKYLIEYTGLKTKELIKALNGRTA